MFPSIPQITLARFQSFSHLWMCFSRLLSSVEDIAKIPNYIRIKFFKTKRKDSKSASGNFCKKNMNKYDCKCTPKETCILRVDHTDFSSPAKRV